MTASPPFSPVIVARVLLRTARTAALATLDAATGAPFASLATVATAHDGTPILLFSRLAAHTRNFLADARASLLIDDRFGLASDDALAGSRITLTGRIVLIPDAEDATGKTVARRRFLARHPEAEGYADFRDFAFYRLEIETAHLVAGFGRINAITGADLRIPLDGADDLISGEPDIVAHMNLEHADATRRYATQLLGQPDGQWRVVGCDPDGIDLAAEIGGQWRDARLAFPHLVRSGGPLRAVLKELADEAGKAEISKSI
jgi:putative heme iron utilization protein